jgi:hypothetical protein
MAGPDPAIHDFTDLTKDVDGHHEGGHYEMRQVANVASSMGPALNQTVVGSTQVSL